MKICSFCGNEIDEDKICKDDMDFGYCEECQVDMQVLDLQYVNSFDLLRSYKKGCCKFADKLYVIRLLTLVHDTNVNKMAAINEIINS